MSCPAGFASEGSCLAPQRGHGHPAREAAKPSPKEQRGTMVRAELGSDALLLLESRPKGSASAQLGVASSGLLLIGQDSSWHAWESILEEEQDGLAS